MWETWVQCLGWEDALEKRKATHSSILAWRIPWTVQSMGSQRAGHEWATFTSLQWPGKEPNHTYTGIHSAPKHCSIQAGISVFFFFLTEIQLIYNAVLISGVQQSGSIIHIYILFQILFPYRLLKDIEHNSLCYIVGPCWLLFYIWKWKFSELYSIFDNSL